MIVVVGSAGPGSAAYLLQAEGYRVLAASDGLEAVALAAQQTPDLVIADIRMPNSDGYELCSRLKGDRETRHVPVVLLGLGGQEERLWAYRIGADAYLAKPLNRVELVARVAALLRSRQIMAERVDADTVLEALAQAAEAREPYLRGHAERSLRYALALAEVTGVSPPEITELRRGALLHDVGKLAIPDAILLKPSGLTGPEWAEVRMHPAVGALICSPLGELATQVVRYHHERWDGQGYPEGLKGEEAPLLARIMALADAFDAMTTTRPYRPALSLTRARDEIRRGVGNQFDHGLAKVFLELKPPVL